MTAGIAPLARLVSGDNGFFRLGGLRSTARYDHDAIERFSGSIDEVAVYNGELAAERILAHATYQPPGQ